MTNKRAVAEGFSWAAGIVVIALIVIFAVFFSIAGKFSQKSVVINYDSNVYSSEYQRVAVYAIMSDFNSSSKGKILSDIYSNANEEKEYSSGFSSGMPTITGKNLVGVPSLPIKNYIIIKRLGFGLSFVTVFYLPCKKCDSKYLPLGLERSKDGK